VPVPGKTGCLGGALRALAPLSIIRDGKETCFRARASYSELRRKSRPPRDNQLKFCVSPDVRFRETRSQCLKPSGRTGCVGERRGRGKQDDSLASMHESSDNAAPPLSEKRAFVSTLPRDHRLGAAALLSMRRYPPVAARKFATCPSIFCMCVEFAHF
jgi:hypothetical protein